MARIYLNPNYVDNGDVKQAGKYLFEAEAGVPSVELVVWLEKSKASDKHPDGKPWIRLPKDNPTNRAYFSEDLFIVSQVNGSVEVEVKTAPPRTLGATGVKQEIVDNLEEEFANEYTALVDKALEAFKAAKANSKKKKLEEMTKEELEAMIAALEAGTKYTPAAAPKSFLDMFTEVEYARYNELLAMAAENKANAPKAERAPLTAEQKAQRAAKRQKTELTKAQALLASLRAQSATGMPADEADEPLDGDAEDYVDEE